MGYLDATGSGNETAARLLQNGRITLLFCAFDGPPLILRLYAKGRSVRSGSADRSTLRPPFGPRMTGERQLIIPEIENVQTSCGFGVPLCDFREHRDQLPAWAERKGEEGGWRIAWKRNVRASMGCRPGWRTEMGGRWQLFQP